MSKAFIASSGIITAIGNNYQENLAALKSGKAGIALPEVLETIHQLPVGEIKMTNGSLAAEANGRFLKYGRNRPGLEKLPRTALLSLLAVQEAWLPIAASAEGLRVGFISANTVGGMDLTEKFYEAYLTNKSSANVDNVRHHECGSVTEAVLNALGMNCWSSTISTACSSSVNSIMMGARMIEQGHYDLIIAGGSDSLSRFTLNGFNSLMILDKELCRPFDENRKGLNLGEGAAYLVLASEQALKHLEIGPKGHVSGFANANDAHHQTASSPEGKGNRLAMEQALERAQLTIQQIDYINLHGTGTENNDSSEGKAIQDLFEGRVPMASSTKAFTGHTLGASGSVETVYSLMSIENQMVWPNLRLTTPMEELSWTPETILKPAVIQHVLSNSFGFGGNCSAIVISK